MRLTAGLYQELGSLLSIFRGGAMPAGDPQQRLLTGPTAAAPRHARCDADDLRRVLAAARLSAFIPAVRVPAPDLTDAELPRRRALLPPGAAADRTVALLGGDVTAEQR